MRITDRNFISYTIFLSSIVYIVSKTALHIKPV